MALSRRYIQVGFLWFCTLNGITVFYIKSGEFRKSRFLIGYRIVHNILVIILTVKFLLEFWRVSEQSFNQSPLVKLAAITYFGLVFISLISCMFCAHYRQDRISNMLVKLQHINEVSHKRGYTPSREEKKFLDLLTVALVTLLILRLAIHGFLNVKRFLRGSHNPCNCFLSECMIFAMNSLAFGILHELCRNWWCLQSGLKMLLLDERPFEDRLTPFRKVLNMFQSLIDMTEDVCVVFRFVFSNNSFLYFKMNSFKVRFLVLLDA